MIYHEQYVGETVNINPHKMFTVQRQLGQTR